MLSSLKSTLRGGLRRLGYDIVGYQPDRAPDWWRQSATFAPLWREIEALTLVPPERCFALHQLARHAQRVAGDFAEIGVYRGGTARLLARTAPDKRVHLFDTFAGMPAVDAAIDWHKAGDFADTSADGVRRTLADCPNVTLHPGFFPDTAGPVAGTGFALVHVDVDIYSSAMAALEFFYPRLAPGGVMAFDDYARAKTRGIAEALDRFLSGKREALLTFASHQAALIKLD